MLMEDHSNNSIMLGKTIRYTIFFAFAVLIFLAIVQEGHAQTVELVGDPGFETQDTWMLNDYGSSYTNSYSHSGDWSLDLTSHRASGMGDPNAFGYAFQDLDSSLMPTGTYNVSVWLKFIHYLTRSTTFSLKLCTYNYPSGNAPIPLDPCATQWTTLITQTRTTDLNWTKYDQDFSIDQTYDIIRIGLFYSKTGYQANDPHWFIDDVSIPYTIASNNIMQWFIPNVLAKTTNCTYTATSVACFDDASTTPQLITNRSEDLAWGFILFLATAIGLTIILRHERR